MAIKVRKLDDSWGKYSPEVVARPVDTFVQPTPADDSQASAYQSLAKSLSDLHTPIMIYADQQHDRDIAKGEKAYGEQPSLTPWENYVAGNPTLPHNPFIKRGYLAAQSSNEATLLNDSMYMAYASGNAVVKDKNGKTINVSESDDTVVFHDWARGFVKRYVTEHIGSDMPPDLYAKVFMPQVTKGIGELAATHVKHRQDALDAKNIAENLRLLKSMIRENINNNNTFHLDEEAGEQELLGKISGITQSMVKQGFSPEVTDSVVFDVFSSLAQDKTIRNREQLLNIAARVPMGDGTLLGDSPVYMKKIQDEIEQNQRMSEAEKELAYRQAERERKERIDAVKGEYMMKALENGRLTGEDLRRFKEATGARPEEVMELSNWATSIIRDTKNTDAAAQKQAYSRAERVFLANHQDGFTAENIQNSGMSDADQSRYLLYSMNRKASAKAQADVKIPAYTAYPKDMEKMFYDNLGLKQSVGSTVSADGETNVEGGGASPSQRMAITAATNKACELMDVEIKRDPTLIYNMPLMRTKMANIVSSMLPAVKKTFTFVPTFLLHKGDLGDWNDLVASADVNERNNAWIHSAEFQQNAPGRVDQYRRERALGIPHENTTLMKNLTKVHKTFEEFKGATDPELWVIPPESRNSLIYYDRR